MEYDKHFSTRKTPQNEPIPGSTQVPDSAGGFAWAVDNWTRLDRFLILGSEGGTYYIGEHALTVENASASLHLVQSNGPQVVSKVVEISEAGRAPKNDPALFILAMASARGNDETRKLALDALPRVARTGTHLFTFAQYVEAFRGWGRGLRNAVSKWYLDKGADSLAYQMVKYRQRNGWSHRDMLRLAHVSATGENHRALFRWAARNDFDEYEIERRTPGGSAKVAYPKDDREKLPSLVHDFEALQEANDEKTAIGLICDNPSLTWEMVPTELLGSKDVWAALLEGMPIGAMIRNLGRMTANGLLVPMSLAASNVIKALGDEERLRKARVHPISVLSAMATYKEGHGARGKLSWTPVREVVDALDGAFYASFGNVEPTGKRLMLALDVSASMGWSANGLPNLNCRDASAAMAMVTARSESQYMTVGFCDHLRDLAISPRQRLDDIVREIQRLSFGGTDCSLPMQSALQRDLEIDAFIVYTDNETWAGSIHPSQALQKYRDKMGIPAKLIVVGMASNGFSIADPNDGGMMDVVGFDTAVPNIMSDFITH